MKNKHLFWLVFLGALALSFLLYGNSIKGGFVYDDKFFAERSELKDSSYLGKIWFEPFVPQNRAAGTFRPLAIFSFALNFIFFGDSPVSFHIINILLNGLVVFLIFILVLKLFPDDKPLAVFSALLFMFMPIHTESVAFIKSRDEILAAIFGILSWILFVQATQNIQSISYKKIWLSAIMFLSAVLSKELIIILPVLFLAIFLIKQKVSWPKILKIGASFFIVAAVYLLWRFLVLGNYAFGTDDAYFIINPLGSADFLTRISTGFKIAFIYIGKTFIPINLSATYHFNHLALIKNPVFSLSALVGIILLFGLIFIALYKKTKKVPLGMGAIIFLLSYSVISKFILKSGDLLAERWMYFPSLGLSIIGGYFLAKLYKFNKKIGFAILAVILSVYGVMVYNRNKVWASNELLYTNMIKTAPNSIQGHINLATVYLGQNKIDKAREEIKRAAEIYKDHPPLLNLMGIMAFKDGDYKLAESSFLRAIQLRPTLAVSYSNLGMLYYNMGQYKKAQEALEYVIKIKNPREEDVKIYNTILNKFNSTKNP